MLISFQKVGFKMDDDQMIQSQGSEEEYDGEEEGEGEDEYYDEEEEDSKSHSMQNLSTPGNINT